VPVTHQDQAICDDLLLPLPWCPENFGPLRVGGAEIPCPVIVNATMIPVDW